MLGESADLAGNAIVETHAEGQEQIGLVHRIVGVYAAVHAQHIQRQGIVAGKGTQAHQGHGHRDAGPSDQLGSSSLASAETIPPPAVNYRPLRGAESLRRPARILSARRQRCSTR